MPERNFLLAGCFLPRVTLAQMARTRCTDDWEVGVNERADNTTCGGRDEPATSRKVRSPQTRRLRALPFAVAVGSSLVSQAAQSADWSSVPSRDNRGTVLIRTNWVDDKGPQGGTATGFVVSKDGHILTVAHQFPEGDLNVLSTGETESWRSSYPRQNFPLTVVHINRSKDFAILVPAKPATLSPVPTSWAWEPLEGAEVNARGFPLGGPLEGMPGRIRRSGASLEVPMNVLLRGGYSGAPVYDDTGKVVCMVRGGTPVADIEDPTVMGLGFCAPLSLLGPEIPAALLRAATDITSSDATGAGGPIRISYSVNTTKETEFSGLQDLTRPESTEFYTTGRLEAAKGYRIVDHEYVEHSATKVTERQVTVSPDGSYLEMTYKLTSGPGYDRWRGWLAATIITIQKPRE